MFGEGGSDAKMFVHELASIYIKYAARENLQCELLNSDDGYVILNIIGKDALSLFKNEHGLHCVQRTPYSEAADRKHTSFVNVCVLAPPAKTEFKLLQDKDLELSFTKGKGPGGQHKNVTASLCRCKHIRTGITVCIDGRDSHSNKRNAIKIVSAKVFQRDKEIADRKYQAKKAVLRQGKRGQTAKIRTYNFIKGLIVDHRTGRKVSDIKGILKGNLRLLH